MEVTVAVGNKNYNFSTNADENVENGDGINLKERPKKFPLLVRNSGNSTPVSIRRKQNGYNF